MNPIAKLLYPCVRDEKLVLQCQWHTPYYDIGRGWLLYTNVAPAQSFVCRLLQPQSPTTQVDLAVPPTDSSLPASTTTFPTSTLASIPFPDISFPTGPADQLTSLALCCIFISFSISITDASSIHANAHGTPNNSALVLTTHNDLPPSINPLFAHDVAVERVEAR